MRRRLSHSSGIVALQLALVGSALGLSPGASAQTGVSDDRVSLPDGPGSLGGVGENASAEGNTGTMSYMVPIEVPHGFTNMAPQLAISYSSGGGTSVVGMGWNLGLPTIERMSSRGVPRYTADDLFAANGGAELVRIPNTDPPVYRARNEGGFVRYTFINPGNEGYWKAEYPDGRIAYFGADAQGASVDAARLGGAEGTFRYHLVEMVDVNGHVLRYSYAKQGTYSLINEIGWVFDDQNVPLNKVTFTYATRDDHVSDCKPGFNMLLQHRLTGVTVYVGTQVMHRYVLTYETTTASGGATRLSRVEQFAADNSRHPRVLSFEYSRALGGICNGTMCDMPIIKNMGNIGVTLASGAATLVDINGDALPDIVETPASGMHRFFLSRLGSDGSHTFGTAVTSTVGTASTRLSQPSVQMLDVNGDGFADLVNTKTGDVLYNTANGDWSAMAPVGTTSLPDLDADAADGQISIRFLDYDNDKRIDLIRSTQTATQIFRNTGSDFMEDTSVEAIGAGFAEDNLQLTDINGDNLLDAVRVQTNQISYRLNYGRGRWAPMWTDITGLPISAGEAIFAELEDINGDGLADLVVVVGNEVKFAINRNGATFDAPQTITMAQGGSIPTRDMTTSVLFADMNGNGSTDVVWVDASGDVTYLEIFPVRPNLLSRIENGLGSVTTVTYASAVEHMARDGGSNAWTHRIPHSMIVVDGIVVRDQLNNLDDDTRFLYHEAYYDGINKQFRGFARIETVSEADMNQDSFRSEATYDLGTMDTYRAGLQLTSLVESNGNVIRQSETLYSDCPLTGVPTSGLLVPVRYVCRTGQVTTIREGAPESEWVTVEEEMTYDGYGNVILDSKLGVTSIGGGGCGACTGDASVFGAPCGAMCLGDEQYTETEYAAPDQPNSGWRLNLPVRTSTYGRADGARTELRTYYDGDAFVGLAFGEVTKGHATRVTAKITANGTETVNVSRMRYDDHGNPVEAIDANGELTSQDNRRVWTYDPTGLRPIRTEQHLLDPDGNPYVLRRDYQYDPVFNQPIQATNWIVVEGGQERSPRNNTFFTYDVHGRITSVVMPGGDTLASPSESYEYDWGSPVSRVITRKRTQSGGALDVEQIRCFDGMGRVFQERTRLANGRYIVSGFVIRNRQGEDIREYQAYESTSDECDTVPPTGVPYEEQFLDGVGRVLRVVMSDGESRGTPSESRTVYLPLAEVTYDEMDTETTGTGTPTTLRRDGQNRVVAIERKLNPNDPPLVYSVTYDELGNLRGTRDPAGNERTQEFNLLGRVTRSTDPDRGVTTWEYDAHGKPTSTTDARGLTTRFAYDGANRILAEWQDGAEATTRVSYTYDKLADCDAQKCTNLAGMVAQVLYPMATEQGQDRYGYDNRGQVTYLSRRAAGQVFEFGHTYDNVGRLVSSSYPKGRTVSYALDGAGRVTGLDSYVPQVGYSTRGLLSTLGFGNGLTTTQEHDDRMHLSSMVTSAQGQTDPLIALGFTRNRLGHVTRITDTASPDGGRSHNAVFGYDGLRRLTSAELDPDRAAFRETITLTYDNLDRILSNTSSLGAQSKAHVGDYTYGTMQPNAVTQAGSLAMEYDGAGNMTRRGTDALEWDYRGRMVGLERAGRTVASFGYGPNMERLLRQEGGRTSYFLTPDYEVRDGVTTLWLRLADLRLVKIENAEWATDLLSDVAPAAIADTTATPEADDAINAADAWIAEASKNGVYTLAGGTTASDTRALLAASARALLLGSGDVVTYLHSDHLGSTVATSNAAGTITHRSFYYPFGQARGDRDGASEDQRYTGKEFDEESGLNYFGLRYADPWTGRWVSADPAFSILNVESLERINEATSPYAFAANNPATGRDREGAFFDFGPVGAAVGAVVGGLMEAWAQKNRGENISWGKVAIAAGVGALAGGFGGLAGVGVMAGARFVEMMAYHAADQHYQEKVASGSMTPEKAHSRATFVSEVVGTLFGAVTNIGIGLAAAAGSVAKSIISVAKESGSATGSILASKYGARVSAWASAKFNKAYEGSRLQRAVNGVGALPGKLYRSMARNLPRLGKAIVRSLGKAARFTARAAVAGASALSRSGGGGMAALGGPGVAAMAIANAASRRR